MNFRISTLIALVLACSAMAFPARVTTASGGDSRKDPFTPSKLPPLTVPPIEEFAPRLESSLRSTKPDFIVFKPTLSETGVSQSGNEHFLVFEGSSNRLMAVWTQSTFEGEADQHIAFAESADGGRTWSSPRIIAGPAKKGDGLMASWAFPLVSKGGTIYVLYSQHVGKFDTFPHTTGQLTAICSRDHGRTWSAPQAIHLPRTSRDNPDDSFPWNCIIWQKPLRLTSDGRYLVGLTRWTSKAVTKNPTRSWVTHDSVVEFLRFENVDDEPEPDALKISVHAWDKHAITVPCPGYPETSVVQEPSIVKLPDGRLFAVMRTVAGSPYWTMSADDGGTWSKARPLLRRDGGESLKHPLSPCPIYDLGGNTAGSGTYALFIHNNDGYFRDFVPADTSFNRRPVYRVIGRYREGAEQPVWFDEPQLFMQHDDLPLGAPGGRGRLDLALYSSLTMVEGRPVLWYPDRKFFLLGKYLD